MKMIRSTSITSTMGVTLIFELTLLPSLRTAIPIVWAPCQRIFNPDGFRRCCKAPGRREAQIGGQKRDRSAAPKKLSLEPTTD